MRGDGASSWQADAERVRAVYRARERCGRPDRYHPSRPEVVADLAGLEMAWARALPRPWPWTAGPVLDVGCGAGSWLRRLLGWGLPPELAHGVDLIPERIEAARKLAPPGMDLRVCSGCELPFEGGRFQLVWAHTVFSSIPDPVVRAQLAEEMVRVTAPEGWILVYDLRYPNPWNPDLVAIRARDLSRAFGGMRRQSWSLTLLPPIARRVTAVGSWLYPCLERCVPPLRSHMLHRFQRLAARS